MINLSPIERLHNAARDGNHILVKAILYSGVDVDSNDSFGQTALHHASNGADLPTVLLLLTEGATLVMSQTILMRQSYPPSILCLRFCPLGARLLFPLNWKISPGSQGIMPPKWRQIGPSNWPFFMNLSTFYMCRTVISLIF
eukprot:TRINITY_DN2804_c0_g1::TRINITY_DN2804_c0_g1_i3::g.6066::m.6066 TRINITY_DN2804_c0_g1::TRINITY_DN2804_c0_g1_i3::g.6066  ORF type:complete len:142 (-),score=-29.53,sp/Q8N7Z5/ANR31_HUMAN/47.37/5e-07,Ank_2/PF12796.2/8.5e-09,Ank_4/PF13637.1/6.4e-08,Ank/PF00023.25/0.26,Ank/PF00023.25/0.023,Ank_5/PF13857.1/3e+02,Ank_5/PF13857.1/0.00054,Ank_3/PF13606.1/8,Ank_3/PF13606.1/2.3,TAXi_C/PF14541.1/0.036 TRINITY_DN2804_c0_g1_i3:253-678(-)